MQESLPPRILTTKVHKISISTRKKLDEGICTIYEQGNQHFLKVNHYTHSLKNMIFGQVKYARSISYFWYQEAEEGFIYVLSILDEANSPEALKDFRLTLEKHAVVKDLINMQEECELHKRVKLAYPQFQTKQVMNTWNALTNISKQVGNLAGMISGLVSKPIEKVGTTIEQKTEAIAENSVSEETKSKWNVVRSKVSTINQKMSDGIKPVADVTKNVSASIGHSFNHSENAVIKAVRNFSMKTKNSLNEGYKQALNQGQNHKPLPAESDSVIEVNVKK